MTAYPRSVSNQTGQASIFVMVMLGVIFISVIFLYQAGRLTTEKMQLQNGADATAYTASTLEARAMNFAAYTNRAMVANEVAIAQAVGLLSFAEELKTVPKYVNAYATIIDGVTGGVAAEFTLPLRAVGDAIGATGRTLEGVLKPIAKPWVQTFSTINKIYSTTQNIYHYTTAALVMDGLTKSLQKNVVGNHTEGDFLSKLFHPKQGDARVSQTSYLALAGHFATYLHGYTKHFKESSEKNEEGMGRFAATVRHARDDFSSGNGKATRQWGIDFSREADLLFIKATAGIEATSKGGAELMKTDKGFVWAAADGADITPYAKIRIRPLGFGPYIKKKVNLLGLPFGTGGYQAATKESHLNYLDLGYFKKIKAPNVYGGAMDSFINRNLTKLSVQMHKVDGDPYQGLPSYRDVDITKNNSPPKLPFSFPFFLIAVEKDYQDLKDQGPQFKDKLDLGRNSESFKDKIATVAKSEVYFSRPKDLSYFARGDHNIEKTRGNLFSPFWQARLVPTTDFDRFFILYAQQGIIWIPGLDGLDSIKSLGTKGLNNLNKLKSLVEEGPSKLSPFLESPL